MNRKRRRNRNTAAPLASTGKAGVFGTVATILAVAILAFAGFGWWMWSHPGARKTLTPATEAATAAPPEIGAKILPDFQKLTGKWVRPDGGYVVEIKNVAEGGRLDAAYFNPRPIHVARAEASREDAAMKVFIELRDVNYPGSTYNLVYAPASDRLEGIYYQAALNQSYEVVFLRMR